MNFLKICSTISSATKKDSSNTINNFTAGTILNDKLKWNLSLLISNFVRNWHDLYQKKNNLNTHYKNLGISANVNLAFRNINTSEPSRSAQRAMLAKPKREWI